MATMAPRKILVVDDDAGSARLCTDVLTMAGYQVQTASNGAEALDLLHSSEYDLVITDVHMPGISGLDLYASATEYSPSLEKTFLFITGDPSKDVLTAINGSGREYIVKPFNIMDFLSRVDKMMVRPIVESMEGEKYHNAP